MIKLNILLKLTKRELLVDYNMKDAIDVWIKYGIDPGSCIFLLLRGKYKTASLHAHELIKPYWYDHVLYVLKIPMKYRGKNMETHLNTFL